MNHTIQEKTISKIRKLLLKSKSTDSEEEQQALFQKAKSIALKNDIDLELSAITEEKEIDKEPFAKDVVSEGGKLPTIHKYIVWIMQNHFKIRVVYFKWNRKTRLTFIGRTNDIEIAKEVYNRLLKTFDWLWKNYKKENNLRNDCKASYMFGLKEGLDGKLQEEKEKTIKEKIYELPVSIQESVGKKLELAIVTEEKQLQKAVGDFYPNLNKGTAHNYGNLNRRDVYSDGVRAGRNINTGNKQLALC